MQQLCLSNRLWCPTWKATLERHQACTDRGFRLTQAQTEITLKNARVTFLKIPPGVDPEFLERTESCSRIYGYRFRPKIRIYGKPIDEYKGNTLLLGLCRSWSTTASWNCPFYPYSWSLVGKQDLSAPTGCSTTWSNTWKSWQRQTLVVESGHPLQASSNQRRNSVAVITNGL